jgi:hypothetical protein
MSVTPGDSPSPGGATTALPDRGPSLTERRPAGLSWPPAPAHGAWIAFALYLIATALFFGKGLLPHPGNTMLGIGTDPVLFQWGYAWYPHAIFHGINPFWSHAIYSPQGADIAQATMVPGPAMVMYPPSPAFPASPTRWRTRVSSSTCRRSRWRSSPM